jgi:hypothetical protein
MGSVRISVFFIMCLYVSFHAMRRRQVCARSLSSSLSEIERGDERIDRMGVVRHRQAIFVRDQHC